jgi:hypothetical protein
MSGVPEVSEDDLGQIVIQVAYGDRWVVKTTLSPDTALGLGQDLIAMVNQSLGVSRKFREREDGAEHCMLCGRHVSQHYGGTEYRCDPRPATEGRREKVAQSNQGVPAWYEKGLESSPGWYREAEVQSRELAEMDRLMVKYGGGSPCTKLHYDAQNYFQEIGSCRDCPFTGSTDGEACACHHPVHPFKPPYGVVEDSDSAGTPPPPECPLRESAYVSAIRVRIEEGEGS